MLRVRNEVLGIDTAVWFKSVLFFVLLAFGVTNNYINVVVIVFCVFLSLIGSLRGSYCNLFILLPYTMIVKMSPTSTSLVTYYMLVVTVLAVIQCGRFERRFLTLLLLFVLYTLMGVNGAYTNWIKLISSIVLLYLFTRTVEQEDSEDYIAAFGFGMVGSSILGHYKETWPELSQFFSDMNYDYIQGQAVARFSGLYLDPNYYGISVVIVLFAAVTIILNRGESRMVFLGMTIYLGYCGFLTYSRNYMIGFLLAIFFVGLYIIKEPRKRLTAAVFFVLIWCFVRLISENISVLGGFIERFQRDDVSGGRLEIWKMYMEHILSDAEGMLLGSGIGAGLIGSMGAHNTYIEALYHFGIVGSVLFFELIRSAMGTIKRRQGRRGFLIVFLVMIATLGCVFTNDFMFQLMLVWIGMQWGYSVGAK